MQHYDDMRTVAGGAAVAAALLLSSCDSQMHDVAPPPEIAPPPPSVHVTPLPEPLHIDRIMPYLAAKDQTDARSSLADKLGAHLKVKVAELKRRGRVADETALAEMQRYLANRYDGLSNGEELTVGGIKFTCIPIRQQPSLRGTNDVIDTPPEAETASWHKVLDQPNSECSIGEIPLREVSLTDVTGSETLRDYLQKDRGLSRRKLKQNYRHLPVKPLAAPDDNPARSSDGYIHRHAYVYQYTSITGILADLNVWSPQVTGSDMSLSQSWILNGDDKPTQSLESGWQVSSDWGTPLAVPFLYSTQDNYINTGCYDLECAGFVQTTNQVIFASFAHERYSVTDGRQAVLHIKWLQKPSNGNWWVSFNGVWIGYYPAKLFAGGALAQIGTSALIEFGGENTGETPNLPMGSGAYPAAGYRKSAFQTGLFFIDTQGAQQPLQRIPILEAPACYTLQWYSLPQPRGTSGAYFYFGGPGSADPVCATAYSSP